MLQFLINYLAYRPAHKMRIIRPKHVAHCKEHGYYVRYYASLFEKIATRPNSDYHILVFYTMQNIVTFVPF